LSSFVLGKENTLFKETLSPKETPPPKETSPPTKGSGLTKAVKKAAINVFKKDYLIGAKKNK
jgi:hypothetical protein